MNTTTARIIVASAIVILLIISGFLLFNRTPSQTKKQENEIQPAQIKPDELTGRWQRTDGGYVIEIRAARNNGTLEASYFNPNPINVSAAEWSMLDNRLNIYVEMSDVNYPGSYYKLVYFPEEDQLVGTYYQAIYKQTYDVQFIRMRNK